MTKLARFRRRVARWLYPSVAKPDPMDRIAGDLHIIAKALTSLDRKTYRRSRMRVIACNHPDQHPDLTIANVGSRS